MTIEEALKKLENANLWDKTHSDWLLEIHHVITEPVCPTVSLRPENDRYCTRYTVTCDTVEEGVERAVDLVYQHMVLGRDVDAGYPVAEFPPRTLPDPNRKYLFLSALTELSNEYGVVIKDDGTIAIENDKYISYSKKDIAKIMVQLTDTFK